MYNDLQLAGTTSTQRFTHTTETSRSKIGLNKKRKKKADLHCKDKTVTDDGMYVVKQLVPS